MLCGDTSFVVFQIVVMSILTVYSVLVSSNMEVRLRLNSFSNYIVRDTLMTHPPVTAIHRMVEACRKGEYELLIAPMPSGWAIMGGSQFLNGYSLLVPDPVVPHLNAMESLHRDQFLKDMAALGDAVLAATGAARINYAMFGNTEPALHAHVIPRYADEVPELRSSHPWSYDWDAATPFSLAVHGGLLAKIQQALKIT